MFHTVQDPAHFRQDGRAARQSGVHVQPQVVLFGHRADGRQRVDGRAPGRPHRGHDAAGDKAVVQVRIDPGFKVGGIHGPIGVDVHLNHVFRSVTSDLGAFEHRGVGLTRRVDPQRPGAAQSRAASRVDRESGGLFPRADQRAQSGRRGGVLDHSVEARGKVQ